MSGICGYITKDTCHQDMLTPMFGWIRQYGDVDREKLASGRLGFGCALNHIPLKVPVDTPILRIGNYIAVIDALLYNRDELGEALHTDISAMSDERVVLEVFRTMGAQGLRLINGDFAGAVHDGEKLVLFRDHMGIRPLFWYQDERMIAFATDLRALLAIPGMDHSLDETYLWIRLNGYIMDESEVTDFEKIKAVHTGSTLTIYEDLTVKKALYWQLNEKKIRFKTEQEYIDKMRELIYDAIRRRLAVAEGQPVGAEMSGGLDSTVIDVIIKKLGVDPVCCSWSPALEQQPMQHHDEREIIEKTCETFGLKCHYAFPKAQTGEEYIDQMKKYKYPPNMSNPFLHDSMAFFRSKGCKIVFSGWGGDEGVSHRGNPYEMWYHKEYWHYLKFYWNCCHGKLKLLKIAKRIYCNLTRDRRYFLSEWNIYEANHLKTPAYVTEHFAAQNEHLAAAIPVAFPYDSVRQINKGANRDRIEGAVHVGSYFDQQYVFPYLDHRVEDFAVSIPRHLFFGKNAYRYIYRAAFQREMIRELYYYGYKDDPGRMTLYWSENDVQSKCVQAEYCKHHQKKWERYIDAKKLVTVSEKDLRVDIIDQIERCMRIDYIIDVNNY